MVPACVRIRMAVWDNGLPSLFAANQKWVDNRVTAFPPKAGRDLKSLGRGLRRWWNRRDETYRDGLMIERHAQSTLRSASRLS